MIKEKEIIVNGHHTNFNYYKNLGYDINYRKPCRVKVNDLMPGSVNKITCICDICNKEILKEFREYFTYTLGLTEKYYCNVCNKVKLKKTCLEKYGVDNPMHVQTIKEKVKNTNLKKYGVNSYSKTDEYKEKYKSTCVNKYGVDNTFKSDVVKEKIKETYLEKYAVEYPQQSEYIRNKSNITIKYKYGVDHYSKTDKFKLDVRNTNIERYGMYYSNTDECKKKIKLSSLEKYGVDHYSKTDIFKSNIKIQRENLTILRYDNLIGDEYDILSYKSKIFKLFHKVCKKESLINRDALYGRLNLDICLCTDCYPLDTQQSYMEIEMQNFLTSLNISYEVNNRTILNSKELDIYIPEYNIAIEMNGVYWHSEIYMDKDYHLKKTLLCKEKGIQLLHVWEDDWKFKRNIIKSIILNKLGLSNKIFARKCIISDVNSKAARLFLDNNHIQGFSPSQIKYGLYYNNELVSLMTFGNRYTNGKKEYELIRFCNKINTNIIGAASRLFKHILKNSDVCSIISYADISLFNGSLYDKLGFIKISLSSPNYFWIIDGIKKHRFNYNKKKLINEGFDKNKTEVEIMYDRGYYRVFSCGQEKWVYEKLI